ncbi:MAG: murein hydrolase activator EnvC family protein [Roseburia sp.]
MRRKIVKKIIAAGLVCGIVAGMSFQVMQTSRIILAKETTTSVQGTGGQSLKEAQNEKAALEKELKKVQGTIAELKDSKGDVEEKVRELNRQLISISARITELENALTAKSEDITRAKEELEAARQQVERQYEAMKVRIRFMYENGMTSYLDTLLSSKNMADFMNAAGNISEIQKYDREKLTEYQQTVEEISTMEAKLEQEYQELEELKQTVEENKQAVSSMMRQKETELANISADILDAQNEADYYAAEIQAQEELIAAIKRAEAEKLSAGVVENPYSGGAFTWPVPSSTRITSDYGIRIAPTSGASSNHQGIDIGAAHGADIVAAAAGTVKVAAYSSAAGNYVMIDHGGGLYTVYMHASSLNVSAGQAVSAGQVIAKIGSTGISTGNHLHFGVSLNGSYVSPWNYLSR